MPTIKTHCPFCGEVSLTPGDIELQTDNIVDPGSESCYKFICPGCFSTVRKQADQRIVRLLEAAGVPTPGQQPKVPKPEKHVVSADEVFDFMDILNDETRFRSWFLQLRKLVFEDRDQGW